MTPDELFKSYEDRFYIRMSDWDSDIQLRNAIYHFISYLQNNIVPVGSNVSEINGRISKFTYLLEEWEDYNGNKSRINLSSEFKDKALILVRQIKKELIEGGSITYKPSK